MTFDIPRDVILPVHSVRVRLDAAPHPFELRFPLEIESNWQREVAANPALFDGQVVLLSRLGYRNGEIEGDCHTVRFATFLHWRRMRPTPEVEHIYTHAMPVTIDHALVAIRMGGNTANAGRVYFASGSFEPSDFTDGLADIDANARREVLEETGLRLDGLARDETLHALSISTGTTVFRRYYFPSTADELVAAIREHVAAQMEPEIEDAVIIRSADDLPQGLAAHMPAVIAWHFSNPVSRQ